MVRLAGYDTAALPRYADTTQFLMETHLGRNFIS